MSSLRNSLHRKNHKERSQLSHRTRLGILEKHKDYVLRARDYHSKQERINRLREKAATRNKDEFYFSMTKEKTVVRFLMWTHGGTRAPHRIIPIGRRTCAGERERSTSHGYSKGSQNTRRDLSAYNEGCRAEGVQHLLPDFSPFPQVARADHHRPLARKLTS